MVVRTSSEHDICSAANMVNLCNSVKLMTRKKFNLYNIDIKIFDTVLELLNGGTPKIEKIEVAKNNFNLVRKRLQTKLNAEMENDKNRPDESLRLIPNPTSAEHVK